MKIRVTETSIPTEASVITTVLLTQFAQGASQGPPGEKGDKGDDGAGPLVLGPTDPVPTGTPSGTVIFRTA